MKPDPATCRWLDRYFGDVCRHPTGEPAGPWFFEPKCKPCRSCGYQPITPETPAWDDPGEEEKEKNGMTNEPSSRPWRTDEYDASFVRDADGRFVARADAADAALIVDAANERDRLRGIVRRLADDIERYHLVGERDRALLREARSALEEGGRS